ncbi:thioredoxin family protein [Teredinibacter turnerae]|uniref:thioredoxin family protein n=2 Tax=Teredinibacter turnerae TaxID=2426 RepID=UPI001E44BDBB|nr:thioredoxin family protein [Teredinibacter turnerae]
MMKLKAVFYHAGCPVCIAAEDKLAEAIDAARYDVEIVHLGDNKSRIKEAEEAGIKSVPAVLLEGTAFHINFGANLSDLS